MRLSVAAASMSTLSLLASQASHAQSAMAQVRLALPTARPEQPSTQPPEPQPPHPVTLMTGGTEEPTPGGTIRRYPCLAAQAGHAAARRGFARSLAAHG